jgi:exopolyphosphatase/guanosine-5'-triphosphate,3'-diphosphate pyrophosphatase
MTRVAAIDCGTNSLRLLVADVDRASVVDVDRRMEVVRLGEGVDRTGVISPEALQRAETVASEYARLMAGYGVTAARMVATSASRDARNAGHFVSRMRGILGISPEVISGDEEAALSFAGALAGLPRVPGPSLVVDLGGGSTEVVLGAESAQGAHVVQAAHSMQIGCVRLAERRLRSDPPTPAETGSARMDIDAALQRAAVDVPIDQAARLVGVAGTVTTVTAHALGLSRYDSAAIHGTQLGVGEVLDACADLGAMSRAQRAGLPYMHPGRVDVIGAGALVWAGTVQSVRNATGLTSVTTSEQDILDGIALTLGSPAGGGASPGTL